MAGEGLLFLGSNLEPRASRLREAERLLTRWGGLQIVGRSAVYETEPVVRRRQPWFLNRVLWVRGPVDDGLFLLALVQRVEAALGRLWREDKGPRTVDVDILDWNGWVQKLPRLTLPHPAIPRRRCILVPLLDVAPDWRHPLLGVGVGDLLRACSDRSAVRLFLPVLDEKG